MSVEISEQFTRSVYLDGMAAVDDRNHPCFNMYEWQREQDYDPLQLPEPFSGREAKLGLAFVGLNPSISRDELIPTASNEWSHASYDEFYRSRLDDKYRDEKGRLCVRSMDGKLSPVRLWNNIERFCNKHIKTNKNENFKLGVDGILIDAIRYKSSKGWIGKGVDRTRIIEHQAEQTRSLIDEGVLSVLVPMGNEALKQIKNTLRFAEDVPSKIMMAMGNSYVGQTDSGKRVTICPIKHMSYPASNQKQEKVAFQILKALGRG